MACTGTCRSCALPGSAGACTAVPNGQDPLGQCADALGATCGTDGFCDGFGDLIIGDQPNDVSVGCDYAIADG